MTSVATDCKTKTCNAAAGAWIMTSPLLHQPTLSDSMSECLVALTITDYSAPQDKLDLDCLSSLHKLQHLDIVARCIPPARWESNGQLSLLTSLRSFSFLRGDLQGPVLTSLSTLSTLTNLVIPNCSEGLDDLSSMTFPALEVLAVRDRECDPDWHVMPIALSVPQSFSSVRSLSLTNCRVTSEATPLRCLPSLAHIAIERCDFVFDNWILDALMGATQITKLSITEEFYGSVPQSVCSMVGLRELYLDYNEIADLPAALAQLSALERLDLSHNEFQVMPGHVLSRMTHLRDLTLFDCPNGMRVTMPLSICTYTHKQGMGQQVTRFSWSDSCCFARSCQRWGT